jgi:hypothetical protein
MPVRRHCRRARRCTNATGDRRPHAASMRWAAPECHASPTPSVSTTMSRRSRAPWPDRTAGCPARALGPGARRNGSAASVSHRCVRTVRKAPTAIRQSTNRVVSGRWMPASRPSSITTSSSSQRSSAGRHCGSHRPSSAARTAVASSSSSRSGASVLRIRGRRARSKRRRPGSVSGPAGNAPCPVQTCRTGAGPPPGSRRGRWTSSRGTGGVCGGSSVSSLGTAGGGSSRATGGGGSRISARGCDGGGSAAAC